MRQNISNLHRCSPLRYMVALWYLMDLYIKDNIALEKCVVVGIDMLHTVQFLVYNELFFTRENGCLQYSINTSG